MPALPPDLYNDIVNLLTPWLRSEDERYGELAISLSLWEGFNRIHWEGNPRTFTARLVHQLPQAELRQMLQRLPVGYQDEQQIATLCERIVAAVQLTGTATDDPLRRLHQAAAMQLTGGRYQLDERFVRLTLLLDQGVGAQGLRFVPDEKRRQYDSLQTLLGEVEERALVLLGRPGSGKTTLLRRLQLELAWAELDNPTGRVPFFVSLNGFGGGAEPQAWLEAAWQRQQPSLPPLAAWQQQGKLILLLDGLNEMPHADKTVYREQIGQWQTFLQQTMHWGNLVLFSCRSLDYSASLSSELVPVRQVQVEPLSPPQIETFLQLYLGEQAAAVWERLRGDEQQVSLLSSPFFLRLLVEQVAATGEMPSGRAGLLTGFVRQALWREVERKRLEPGLLLSEDDVQQVVQNAWATTTALPTEGALLPQLAVLAHGMQAGRQGGEAGQVRIREQAARELLPERVAEGVVMAGVQLNVLDKELATRELLFSHQLLQEYFAARRLAQQPEPKRVAVDWQVDKVVPSLAETVAGLAVSDPLPGLPTTGWEETTLLAAAMTLDPTRFVTELVGVNLPLAGRCGASPEVALPPELRVVLQQGLLARLGDPKADLRARLAAAEALGELGDPRFERWQGAYGAYLLPPLVEIVGGAYQLGDDDGQFEDEKPAHEVTVAPFAIGMFPVTNEEFRLFMVAGGYEEERWWQTEAARLWRRGEGNNEGGKVYYRDLVQQLQGMSEEAIQAVPNLTPDQVELLLWLKRATVQQLEAQLEEWYPTGKIFRQPGFWEDSRFNGATQPVVGICWYEAQAYCAWLAAQTGQGFRLPTEAEWEVAARGLAGRQYAWEGGYDAAYGNSFETHVRRTTPVGVFPGGATPEGVMDLSGNVWEWTSSQFRSYPYVADDGREDAEDGLARRVLRGGSWNLNHYDARAVYRDANHPLVRDNDDGFRVVVGASSPIS